MLRARRLKTGWWRRKLSQNRRAADAAKCGYAALGHRAPDFARNAAAPVAWGSTVVIRLELDELTIRIIADWERTTSVLHVAFRVADVKHLLQGNGGLVWWPQLVYLAKNKMHIMVTARIFRWADRIELFAGLYHQQSDRDRSRCMRTVEAPRPEGIVVQPAAP